MKFSSQIEIEKSPEIVWACIADPDLLLEWNPKIEAIEALGPKEPALHRKYRFAFQMSSKKQKCDTELTEFNYPNSLTWSYQGVSKDQKWSVTDRYALESSNERTLLRRELDLSKAPLPKWIRPIVWFIMKFGRPVGTTQLQALKAFAESL